ncbi:MAG: endonuclease V [Acidilobaceae archaeon]
MIACEHIVSRFRRDIAIKAQTLLASRVVLEDHIGDIREVAGLDVAYVKLENVELGIGVASLIDWVSLEHKASFYVIKPICVPYIPGLLAFREMEVLTPLLLEIENRADLFVVDGHGIAHPRFFGIASHLGLVFDKPSIGVAKHKLVGLVKEQGDKKVLIYEGKIVAEILDKDGITLFVSPGHKVSLETATKLIKRMNLSPGELPEPTRLADALSKQIKARIQRNKALDQLTLNKIIKIKTL